MFATRTARLKKAISQMTTIVIVVVVIVIIAGGAYAAITLTKGSSSTTSSSTATQSLVALAQKETGSVTIYGVLDTSDWVSHVQPNLTNAYPFLSGRINYVGLGAADISNRAISECLAHHVSSDLLIDTLSNIISVKQANCLQAWNDSSYELSVGYNANTTDLTGYWHPGYILPEIIMYNNKLVTASSAPKSYSDLASATWKGNFVMQDPSLLSGTGTTFATLFPMLGNSSWTTLMDSIAANKPVIISSNGVAYTDIQSGQYPVGFGQLNDYIAAVNEAKTNSSFTNYVSGIFPNPVVGAPNVEAVTGGAAHLYSAELIIQWLTSSAGQAAYWASGRPPMNPSAFSQDTAAYIPAGTNVLPGGVDNPTFYTDPSYWSSLFVKIFGP